MSETTETIQDAEIWLCQEVEFGRWDDVAAGWEDLSKSWQRRNPSARRIIHRDTGEILVPPIQEGYVLAYIPGDGTPHIVPVVGSTFGLMGTTQKALCPNILNGASMIDEVEKPHRLCPICAEKAEDMGITVGTAS